MTNFWILKRDGRNLKSLTILWKFLTHSFMACVEYAIHWVGLAVRTFVFVGVITRFFLTNKEVGASGVVEIQMLSIAALTYFLPFIDNGYL